MQVRAHLANLEKGQKQVCLVFEEWTSSLNPGPVSPLPRPALVLLITLSRLLPVVLSSFLTLLMSLELGSYMSVDC